MADRLPIIDMASLFGDDEAARAAVAVEIAAACDLPFTSIPQEPDVLHWALSQPCDGPRLIEVRVTL